MKRLLCLILAGVLFVSLAACGDTNASSEAGSSAEESLESSEESKEVFTPNELIAEINAFFGGNVPDRTMKANNLFEGLSYTFSEEPVADYGDPNYTKLTDGATRDVFDKWNWVSFKSSKAPSVTFDLGGTEHALADIEINMLRQVSYGIELPASVQIELSEDGENFTAVSTLQTPSDIAESGKYVYRFAFPETVSAQFVRVTMNRKESNFLFVDEITAYEYREDGKIDVSAGQTSGDADLEYDYYGYLLETEITVPVSNADTDYDTQQNLALLEGVDVQVKHFDPFEQSYLESNTPIESLSMLTDGKKASSVSYGDQAFAHFYRGYGRHIVIDLGNEMAVDKVCMEFLNHVAVGIGAPPAVMVSVSNDGENWVTAYGQSTGLYGDSTVQLVQVDGTFRQAYRCRYVRVSFPTVPHNETTSSVYLSEIEVFGKKNTENIPEAQDDAGITMGRYPDAEAFGAENILLAAVAGMPGDENYDGMSEESALLHLAYHDEDGNITDTFFDSVLFAPTVRFQFQNDVKQSADRFMDELFAEGHNLHALNNASETVKTALNLTENATVWMNLMCPKTNETCSDVDGDGKAEDFSTAEGRFAYLKYQIDHYIERFADAGFEHLDLLGFYWNDECLFPDELALNCETIKMTNDYIHSLGYKSFWCPYYNAYGIWLWQEVGFDFASLQPNYMFYATETTRLSTAADIALIYGMGIELEIEDAVSEGSFGLYREYLRAGYDHGHMNSVKLYYQGGMPGAITRAANGTDGQNRGIYDDTYLYAKRKLDDSYNIASAADTERFKDLTLEVRHGRSVDLTLGDTEGYTVRIMKSTVYGSFRLDLSGEGSYRAMKNFCGEDTVVLEISDGTGNRKTVTITVNVTE